MKDFMAATIAAATVSGLTGFLWGGTKETIYPH